MRRKQAWALVGSIGFGMVSCGEPASGSAASETVEPNSSGSSGGLTDLPTSTEPASSDGTSTEHSSTQPTSTDVGMSGEDTGSTGTGSPPGDPIVVAPEQLEQWVWAPIPAMRCADGSSAGVMVNFTAQSRDVMVFFQGGGACWNQLTCAAQGQALAAWEADPFATWKADGGPIDGGLLSRSDPQNPLAGHNFVYVPYCTGDGHLGAEVAAYGVHHVGYLNVGALLERLVPSFLDATQVVVAGFSAGGMGATGNYHQIASAFAAEGVEVQVLINDAGPFMRPGFLKSATTDMLRAAWGLDLTVDTWCPDCASAGYHMMYSRQAELHPGVRSSLLCAYEDSVVRLLYGVLGSAIELGACEDGLRDLGEWRDSVAPAVAPSLLREFYYPGDRHGATEGIALAETPGLAEFLTAQLDGDPQWVSVRP